MHVFILIALLLAAACGPTARAVQASRCEEQGNAIIMSADSCQAASAGLERLVERSPECAALYFADSGGARMHCKEKDGGTRDAP